MDSCSAACSKLPKQAPVLSKDEGTHHAYPTTFNGLMDDVTDSLVTCVSGAGACESPGTKRIHEMTDGMKTYPIEHTPVHFKVLERPISSGAETAKPPQYQMKAVDLRSAQVKRPNVPRPQWTAAQIAETVSPEIHASSQSEVPVAKPEWVDLNRATHSETDESSAYHLRKSLLRHLQQTSQLSTRPPEICCVQPLLERLQQLLIE